MGNAGFIVVSGLPAAGKSSLGRLVADSLGFPFLDKDDILEAEFDKYPAVDMELRQRLSRESDLVFTQRAASLTSGVLVSFWRPANLSGAYGTATNWIATLGAPAVELHCKCEPRVARDRFLRRSRHAGHNDNQRLESLVQQFDQLASIGPLGLWPCVTAETTDLRDISELVETVSKDIEDLLDTCALRQSS